MTCRTSGALARWSLLTVIVGLTLGSAAARAQIAGAVTSGKTGTAQSGIEDWMPEYQRLHSQERYGEAVAVVRPRAQAGEAEAQAILGYLYASGEGVVQDHAEAARWSHKAAAGGSALAMNNLGKAYEYGQGVRRDLAEAARYYRSAAERGYVAAQARLGALYQAGTGLEQDLAEAARWFSKAAVAGDLPCQNQLGFLYATWQGVVKDLAAAQRWWRQAAAAGYPEAQVNLGRMYHRGEGVPQDSVEAERWYRRAADQGHTEAARRLERLRQETTPRAEAAPAPFSSPNSSGALPAARSPQPTPRGDGRSATIYLIRKKQALGMAVRDQVRLDGLDWGQLRSGSYLEARVVPGPHLIEIGGPTHRKRFQVSQWVTLEPGQVLYLFRNYKWSGAKAASIERSEAASYLGKYRAAGSFQGMNLTGG